MTRHIRFMRDYRAAHVLRRTRPVLMRYVLSSYEDNEVQKAVEMLRTNGKQFYVKYDLRMSAPSVDLSEVEKDSDCHNVSWIEEDPAEESATGKASGKGGMLFAM